MLKRVDTPPVEVKKVAEWSFDASAGQINAVDEQGCVLMAIQTSPLFGPRLAAAFMSPAHPPAPAGRSSR